jgi:hypothetical protein
MFDAPRHPAMLSDMIDTDVVREIESFRSLVGQTIARIDASGDGLSSCSGGTSAWTPLQHYHHAGRASRWALRSIERILAGSPDTGAPGPPSPQAERVLRAGSIPRGAAGTPEMLRPPTAVVAAEVQEMLGSLAARLGALSPRAQDLAAADRRLPHFALGPLTPAEWIRFARIHFEHHAAIAAEDGAPAS